MADEQTDETLSTAAEMTILTNGDSHPPKEDAEPADESGKKKKKKKKKTKPSAAGK